MNKSFSIALVGNPNCGKSALFNTLTGSRQRVANYSGVTIEKKYGYLITLNQNNCTIIDLPGTYSLNARSPDEKITQDIIFGRSNPQTKLDLIICVLDASNLHNGLRLALELKQSKLPMILALNMMDIAKSRGYIYDLDKLSQILDLPVIPVVAIKNHGIYELVKAIDDTCENLDHSNTSMTPDDLLTSSEVHSKASEIINQVTIKVGTPSTLTQKIDKVLLHPIWGILILLLVLFTLFQSVFSIATIPQQILQNGVDFLQNLALSTFPNSLFGSLLGNAVIAGIGSILVFLPQILTISLFVILLEDSGYMARAAFLMDRLMGFAGLHGKAFIPLLSSFACAIPGIMATRTIENKNDRLVTILISPLMACSARLPIYTLLISAFIPNKLILGLFNLQGLVMFGLYLIGIVFALLVALTFKYILFRKNQLPSIIELPSYKLPRFKNVMIELIKPSKMFIKRAGTIIFALMVVLWFLASFPSAPSHATNPAIDYSFVGMIGKSLLPIFVPIGFSWQIIAALIPGLAAREVAVSALGTIYALSGDDATVTNGLSQIIHNSWSLPTALALLAWYVFAPQCVSTLAVAKRETNSWKWPLIMFSYQIGLAYAVAFIIFRVSTLFGL